MEKIGTFPQRGLRLTPNGEAMKVQGTCAQKYTHCASENTQLKAEAKF